MRPDKHVDEQRDSKRYTNTFLKKTNFKEGEWTFWRHYEKLNILLFVIDSKNEIYEWAKSRNLSKMRDKTKGRDFSDHFSDEKVPERWTNIIPHIWIKLLKFEVRVLRLNKRVI